MKGTSSIFYTIREIIVLTRLQFIGTSVISLIGALTVKGADISFKDALILFTLVALLNIFGHIINDILDVNIDKRSKELKERPLVKGTISIKLALYIHIFTIFLFFIIAIYFYPNILALIILVIAIIFGYLYNIFSKKLPGADLFLSVTMSFLCLFGAMVVTKDFVNLNQINLITWIVVGISFIHVFTLDALGGGLKDAKNDKEAGAKTIAVVLGVRANKNLFIPLSYKIIILTCEALTAFLVIYAIIKTDAVNSYLHIGFLIFLIFLLFISSLKMLSIKVFDRKKIMYFNRYHEIAGFALVPVLLFESIGILWILFLVTLPILWFIIVNKIMYNESWFKPKSFG